MDHFKPAGERARWKPVYELLQKTNTGDLITYDEMGKLLNLDPLEDRLAIRAALYRAAKELEEVDKRAVAVVPNRGYQVVPPKQNLVLARKQQTRSTKALKRGYSKAVNVDWSQVDPETRKALEVTGQILGHLMDFSRRADDRLNKYGEVIESLMEAHDQSQDVQDELRQRLERLERQMNERLGITAE